MVMITGGGGSSHHHHGHWKWWLALTVMGVDKLIGSFPVWCSAAAIVVDNNAAAY